ncbi:hypothetical protein A6K26_006395 [Gammaproteobacteria bacterium 2W06]|nr:hypothetical protein A6K26_006395 [Gammaproteobacteria bacterium 2W06]
MPHFALRVGAETPKQIETLKRRLESHYISLENLCNKQFNIRCSAGTLLETGIDLDRETPIDAVIQTAHQCLQDLNFDFTFYVAADFTTDESFGCLTYIGSSFKRTDIPAPETLESFELCLREIYLQLGEDEATARSLAETDAGDHLNEFRDFLQEEFSIECLTDKSRLIDELALSLSNEINNELSTTSEAVLIIKPLVNRFLEQNELLA